MTDTGEPISVPVGDITKGHVFNVTGEVLNLAEGEKFEITERWPIHRKAPAFDQLESKTTMFETGIKSSTCSPRTSRVGRSASSVVRASARRSSSRR